MLERATTRMLPLVNRAADYAPIAPACCNVCRTCTTTNIVGLLSSAAVATSYGVVGLIRKLAGRRARAEADVPFRGRRTG